MHHLIAILCIYLFILLLIICFLSGLIRINKNDRYLDLFDPKDSSNPSNSGNPSNPSDSTEMKKQEMENN